MGINNNFIMINSLLSQIYKGLKRLRIPFSRLVDMITAMHKNYLVFKRVESIVDV
jgi:hypothetical protein